MTTLATAEAPPARLAVLKDRPKARNLLPAFLFLMPNFFGFVIFVVFPVIFSLYMAFTDWSFQIGGSAQFVGLRNFRDLASDGKFWFYFYNTIFFMIGIPISIAGSLFLAILLSQNLRGIVFFRTLCYLPHFTSGVALFVLWKHLYNPEFGPINAALRPILGTIENAVRGLNPSIVKALGWLIVLIALAAFLLAMKWVLAWCADLLRKQRHQHRGRVWPLIESGFVCLLVIAVSAFFFGALTGIIYLAGNWVIALPQTVAHGSLEPPKWLGDMYWSKPAIMMMGIWAGVGGNTMLLYLAGISNVPPELYEAAEIDGAGAWAQFKHITWPQLMPTTFFILVMSLIGGLQGGFETARVMTQGGPAGSTTTLSYYIYTKGFESREMGYACAVAWTLFAMIFLITALKWKYGSEGHSDVT